MSKNFSMIINKKMSFDKWVLRICPSTLTVKIFLLIDVDNKCVRFNFFKRSNKWRILRRQIDVKLPHLGCSLATLSLLEKIVPFYTSTLWRKSERSWNSPSGIFRWCWPRNTYWNIPRERKWTYVYDVMHVEEQSEHMCMTSYMYKNKREHMRMTSCIYKNEKKILLNLFLNRNIPIVGERTDDDIEREKV